ncbi:DoxX family protein [Flavihumibacter sp. R14]|nr:DoxX family protein [Flavihumibacter soli]
MKRLFNVQHQDKNIDIAILILRVSIASLMLVHGIPKLLSLVSGDAVQFPALIGSPEISLALAVFAEVFCSILILFGLSTRLATIPLIITMLVAVFLIHAADPFANKEIGLHYLIGYVILLVTGSGKISLDHLLLKRTPYLA